MTVDERSLLTRFSHAQEGLVLQAADLSLQTLASMVESGTIDVSPYFQRRDRWKPDRQSALIESFVLNIPVPPIYLSEDESGTYSVIDGKQRITAVATFLADDLELRDLTEFKELNGLRYSGLPRAIQNALQLRPLRAVTLLKQSDEELKYEVFHRLNSAGEPLNAQEIRNVVFRGPLNRVVYRLAEDEFLRQQLKIRSTKDSAYRRMQDAEFVLRFMTLAESWSSFSGDLARSMDDFMKARASSTDEDLTDLEGTFLRSLRAAERLWGNAAFKRPDRDDWRDQALAGMYDAQMVAVGELDDGELDRLQARPTLAMEVVRRLFDDPEFEDSVRVGTNTPSRVKYRVQRLRDELRASLNQ